MEDCNEEAAFLASLCAEDAAGAALDALDALDADVLVGDGLELLLVGPLEEDGVAVVAYEASGERESDLALSSQLRDGAIAQPLQLQCSNTPKQSAYVNRPKQELEYLRREIVELETQLASAKSAAPGAGDAADGQRQSAATLWERLANRQKEERVKAEIENEKLREMLDGQLRIARSLEKVLRKRAASSTVRAWRLAGLCVLEADDVD